MRETLETLAQLQEVIDSTQDHTVPVSMTAASDLERWVFLLRAPLWWILYAMKTLFLLFVSAGILEFPDPNSFL